MSPKWKLDDADYPNAPRPLKSLHSVNLIIITFCSFAEFPLVKQETWFSGHLKSLSMSVRADRHGLSFQSQYTVVYCTVL